MNTDDVDHMLEVYDETKIMESNDLFTKTFLDDVHHLSSFIRNTEIRVTKQLRCHNYT